MVRLLKLVNDERSISQIVRWVLMGLAVNQMRHL